MVLLCELAVKQVYWVMTAFKLQYSSLYGVKKAPSIMFTLGQYGIFYSYKLNTLRAHDAFMRHGYKSRIFVHISTHASGMVSAVNAADAILR